MTEKRTFWQWFIGLFWIPRQEIPADQPAPEKPDGTNHTHRRETLRQQADRIRRESQQVKLSPEGKVWADSQRRGREKRGGPELIPHQQHYPYGYFGMSVDPYEKRVSDDSSSYIPEEVFAPMFIVPDDTPRIEEDNRPSLLDQDRHIINQMGEDLFNPDWDGNRNKPADQDSTSTEPSQYREDYRQESPCDNSRQDDTPARNDDPPSSSSYDNDSSSSYDTSSYSNDD